MRVEGPPVNWRFPAPPNCPVQEGDQRLRRRRQPLCGKPAGQDDNGRGRAAQLHRVRRVAGKAEAQRTAAEAVERAAEPVLPRALNAHAEPLVHRPAPPVPVPRPPGPAIP